jgi:hypothetical protein
MNIRHWSCRAVALMMLWLFTAGLFAAQNPAASGRFRTIVSDRVPVILDASLAIQNGD